MKKSFAARRVPRKIGGDEEEESHAPASNTSTAPSSDNETSSVVKRPSGKSRKSSSLRTSFGLSAADDSDEPSKVVTPKRGNLSRLAIQRNAEKRGASDIPFRSGREDDEERPSYDKSYLEELKQSTPSTPKDLSAPPSDSETQNATRALDLSSKFGKDLSRYNSPSAIPTDAEIKEKKERRARLAKEGNFMSLEGSDEENGSDDNVTHDDQGRLILKPEEKYPETRLVREDEDILEDFDDFTSDGRIALGRKAEREADAKRKAEMAAMIADAEGQSEDEDEADESENERNAAFEVAQTRHGTYASRAEEKEELDRPRTPPRIAPLPTLDGVVDRLRKRLEEMHLAQMAKTRETQSLVAEKRQIAEEEVRVQAALKETGEKYAKLREKMDVKPEESQMQIARTNGDGDADMVEDDWGLTARAGLGGAGLGSTPMVGRGLESLGGTPMRATPVSAGSETSDY